MEDIIKKDEPFDLIDVAVLHEKVTVFTSGFFELHTKDPLFKLAANHPSVEENDIFQTGQVQYKGNSKLYSAVYIDDFKDDLLEIFEKGQNDSWQKIHPGKM